MFRRRRKLYFQKATSKLPVIVFSVSLVIGGFFLFKIIATLITANNNNTVELMPGDTDSVSLAKVEEVSPPKGVTKKPIETSRTSVKTSTETVQGKQIKSEFYAIQVATFQDRKRAEDLVNQLKGKKYSPLYIKTRGKLVEVYVGKFESPRESGEALSQLRKDFRDAFTRKLYSPFDEM